MSFLRKPIGLLVLLALTAAIWTVTIHFRNSSLAQLRDSVIAAQSDIRDLRKRKVLALQSASGFNFPAEAIWPAEDRSKAELLLQQLLVNTASELALNIVAFGPSQIQRDTNNEHVSFEVEVEGSLRSVYSFLAGLEASPKWVGIGSLRIRPASYAEAPHKDVVVYMHLTAWILWGESTI